MRKLSNGHYPDLIKLTCTSINVTACGNCNGNAKHLPDRKTVREKLQSVVDNPSVRQIAAIRMDNRDFSGVWDLRMQMEPDSTFPRVIY